MTVCISDCACVLQLLRYELVFVNMNRPIGLHVVEKNSKVINKKYVGRFMDLYRYCDLNYFGLQALGVPHNTLIQCVRKNLYPPKNVDIMTKKAFIHKFIPTYCTFSRDSIQLSKNLLYHGPLHTHLSIYSSTHFLVKFMKCAFNLPVVHSDPFLPCERASKTLKCILLQQVLYTALPRRTFR